MAKKRQPTTAAANDDQPLTPASKNDQPPPSKKPEEEKVEEKEDEEATSEEDSSSEGEEDDDDDEEDDEEEQTPSSKTTPPAKSESKKDEDNEDEEETDTDSDHEPPPKLKSINSKSIDETVKSKPQPKSTAAPARSGTKRSADEDNKQSKKKKTIAAADDEKEKEKEKEKEVDNKKSGDDSKKLFQRVFTEDDELAIMKGLFDFVVKTGNDPLKYPTAFYDYVKKFIHFPATLEQLKDKVRRLKLKFENKLKTIKNGKTPTFSKPIEEKMFEFGKKIWGSKIIEENGKPNEKPSKKELAVKKSPTTKKLVMEPDLPLVVANETRKVGSSDGNENPGLSLILNEMERFDRTVSGVFGSGTDFLKSGVELIEESKRVELERRWKELRVAELKVLALRAELAEEQSRLILDALQSSSSD